MKDEELKHLIGFEAAESAVTDIGKVIAMFFNEMVKNGLTREEALELTSVWIANNFKLND
jgi:hypothetical protein